MVYLNVRRMRPLHQSPSHCFGKVTVVEFFWVVLWIAGAVTGFQIGRVYFGMIGAVVGLVLGFGVGLLVSCGVAYLLNLAVRRKIGATHKSASEQ